MNNSSASQPSSEHEAALAALRQIVEDGRAAHLTTNVDLLLAHTADPLLTVSNGAISLVSLAASRDRFKRVFDGAIYQEWDFLEPPVIRLANDASVASVISRVRVRRTKRQSDGSVAPEAFIYAGIDTFEMRQGGWVKTANLSTFAEE